ncbi:MAG TPA: phosphate ABC transporter substrate-binding protein PstS [Gemmatimonadaceae bacterium]|nr:phosphate ABC transporter substrate-binding protein PstS [Gemmatimonadaceae bacterium]
MSYRFTRAVALGLTAVAVSTTAAIAQGADLTGAGSSFAYPIYSKWASIYAEKTGVKINYQSIGSSGGIRQLSDQTVDFGASDGPMTDDQMSKAKGGPILHIPTVLGAVAITYNLPDVKEPLRLTGDVLANIYLGKVTKWNDASIAALNRGVKLPGSDIVVVHRSDGSGTSYIFTDYLATVSPAWASGPGKAQSVNWPVGLGGKGSEGVTGQVKQTPGAIGYVELSYAKENKLPTALIKNAAGQWIAPTIDGVTEAAAGASAKLPATTDFRISIVNAPGRAAYPISSFTWVLLYKNPSDAKKGKQLVDFLRWAIHDGEKEAPSLDYAPLPASMVTMLDKRLNEVKLAAQ